GWGIASGQAGRAASPSAVVVEVKAIACELPATRGVPLGRWSLAELRQEVITTGLVDQVSVSTLWRWLDEDALKPWRHRSWIFPRDPDFAAKAAVVLDLYQRRFHGRRLEPGEFVISADAKTSIQGRCPRHPTPSPGRRLEPGEFVIPADEKPSIQARCRCHPTCRPGWRGRCGSSTNTSAAGRWPTWRPGTSTGHGCLAVWSPPPASARAAAWSARWWEP